MNQDHAQSATTVPFLDQPMVARGFVRNAWYMAGWLQDFAADAITHKTLLGEPIAIFRTGDGQWIALEDRCVHRFAPLSRGQIVDGCKLQCPYHGLQYDASGACVYNPHGNQKIPPRSSLRAWPVAVKHKILWIWMGSTPALFDRIPDFSVLDSPPEIHTTKLDYMLMKANYQLIIDNLLDLSHTSYLHEGLIGNADTVHSVIDCRMEGNDVMVTRHASKAAAPSIFAQCWPGHPDKVDKLTAMRWMAPSTMHLISCICEVGTDPMTGTGFHALHLLTPETERTTHYFFTAVRFGVKTSDLDLNRTLQASIARLRRFAFEEQDAPIIEAQQRNLDSARRVLEPTLLEIDAGPVRYKRILAQLLIAEREAD